MDDSPTSFAISDAISSAAAPAGSSTNAVPWFGIFLLSLLVAALWFYQDTIKQWYQQWFQRQNESQRETQNQQTQNQPSGQNQQTQNQKQQTDTPANSEAGHSMRPTAPQEQEEHTMAPGVADRIEQVVRSFSDRGASYESDSAISDIQTGNKTGWCYIGEDRGYRACASVGMRDQCMSGDIFPSHDICINPTLRA